MNTSTSKSQLLSFKLKYAERQSEHIAGLILGINALSSGLVQSLCERGWSPVEAAQAVLGQLQQQIRTVLLDVIDAQGTPAA